MRTMLKRSKHQTKDRRLSKWGRHHHRPVSHRDFPHKTLTLISYGLAAAESTTTPTAKPLKPVKVPKISQAPISVEPPASLTPQVCTFDSVPGPQSLRLISRFWSHVPLLSAEFTGGALFQVMNMGRLLGKSD